MHPPTSTNNNREIPFSPKSKTLSLPPFSLSNVYWKLFIDAPNQQFCLLPPSLSVSLVHSFKSTSICIGALSRYQQSFLVALLLLVNLVGLLVQSVFYYVCKSYHHQEIDKSALQDHLGGYLGEYVPLKSGIQMEEM